MKKQFIAGFTCGAVLFGVVGVFAGQYVATENPFPIKLNGNSVAIEGYNIEGSTYFKLRDIADTIGGFDVDFQNDTIQLSQNGYVYDNTTAKLAFTDTIKDYFAEYAIRIPEFTEADINSADFAKNFTFYYYTGVGEPNGPLYHNGYFNWDENIVKAQYKLLFGVDMPDFVPTGESVKYNNGSYEIMASNYGDEMYVFNSCNETPTGLELVYTITDSENTEFGHATFILAPADNANGFIITSKTVE